MGRLPVIAILVAGSTAAPADDGQAAGGHALESPNR